MCKECGCGETNGNTRLQFTVTGYTDESAKDVERALFGFVEHRFEQAVEMPPHRRPRPRRVAPAQRLDDIGMFGLSR